MCAHSSSRFSCYLRPPGVSLHVPVERVRRHLIASIELLSRQTTQFDIADQLFSFAPDTAEALLYILVRSCLIFTTEYRPSPDPLA
jgi:hypothetical protein